MGRIEWRRGAGRQVAAGVLTALLSSATVVMGQEVSFDTTIQDLSSRDVKVRTRAADMLRSAAYPESAIPLAALIGDPVDDIQLIAIGAELNIFLVEKVTPKKRIGFVIEQRGNLSAQAIFNAGPAAFGSRRVPLPVALALVQATADRTVRVALEALHAFGALAPEVAVADRATLLTRSAPLLEALLRSPDPLVRMTALSVVARVFAPRPGDAPFNERLGDAVIATLNAYENPVRETALWVLGVVRYQRSVQALNELLAYYRKGPMADRAFDSIGRIAHEANMPQFIEYLNGRNRTWKLIAIEGIARSGDTERLPLVHAALQKERLDAMLLGGHFANARLADGAVDAIVEALDRPKLREQALHYVHELVAGRAAAFGALVRPANGRVRLELIDALGLAGDASAIPVLQTFAGDKDPDVDFAARRAIARLQ